MKKPAREKSLQRALGSVMLVWWRAPCSQGLHSHAAKRREVRRREEEEEEVWSLAETDVVGAGVIELRRERVKMVMSCWNAL